jgi:hypothetical protein
LSTLRAGGFGVISALTYSPQMQCFGAQCILFVQFVAQVKLNP